MYPSRGNGHASGKAGHHMSNWERATLLSPQPQPNLIQVQGQELAAPRGVKTRHTDTDAERTEVFEDLKVITLFPNIQSFACHAAEPGCSCSFLGSCTSSHLLERDLPGFFDLERLAGKPCCSSTKRSRRRTARGCRCYFSQG